MRAIALAIALLLAFPGTLLAHWPTKGRVSQWFTRSHRAIDIAAPRGTAVRAIANGKVVYAGWRNNCGGWQVWIRHDGYYSGSYHLSRKPLVVKGDVVTTSTRIGVVGATGCATGPHVHLEVWKGYPWRAGSVRVNPIHYINHPKAKPKIVQPPPLSGRLAMLPL